MSRIRGRNTKPELLLRRGLHARGLRFRLHRRDLPGRPDLVFPRFRTVVFVHGCFWHGHGCHLFTMPATRPDFWKDKIGRNAERDGRAVAALRADGWRVLTVWECALRGRGRLEPAAVLEAIEQFLSGGAAATQIRGDRHGGRDRRQRTASLAPGLTAPPRPEKRQGRPGGPWQLRNSIRQI
jgi:DNA mismatch endonuclease (patch repair protein)